MVDQVNVAEVRIWDQSVGAVAWNRDKGYGTFEFAPSFLELKLDLAPLMMPIQKAIRQSSRFEFRNLRFDTFHGLPGLLSDSLPDKFGNAIINQWLASKGRTVDDFSPIERLCYTGTRGMGALEFQPAYITGLEKSVPIEVVELVEMAQSVLDERFSLVADLNNAKDELINIIRVGTSAGGNRPKAVIAWDEKNNKILSGQVEAPKGYDYWLMKFDGVKNQSLGDPEGYGRIEYAYYLMAKACEIEMTQCKLYKEGDRAHFMTKRFDRPGGNKKLHVQTLCGIAHYDFNSRGDYSYEQAFQVMRELRLPPADAVQLYRRMVFNVVARNQDDHTKNIAFIMDPKGVWRLSPAFDVTYSYNPTGLWTNQHQMKINSKSNQFTKNDLLKVGKEMNIKKANEIIEQVIDIVSQWAKYAKTTGVDNKQINDIGNVHRLNI